MWRKLKTERQQWSSIGEVGHVLLDLFAHLFLWRVLVAVNAASVVLERHLHGAMHLLDQLRVDVVGDI